MSQKIKDQTKELATREASIKRQLLGQSKQIPPKINQIGKMALIGGGLTLLFYMAYRSFSPSIKEKPKKRRKSSSYSGIGKKFIVFILPYLGRILDKLLDESKNKKETTDADED